MCLEDFENVSWLKFILNPPPSIITQIMHKKNWLSWLGRGHGWCGLRRQIQANLPYWQLAHPQVSFVQCFSSSILKIWFFKDYASWCLERQIHELQRQGYLIVFMLMFGISTKKKSHNCLNDTDGGKQPHSGAERSPGQKKHIIDGSYIIWIVCAVRFRNSWRKNMALGSFGILEKYGIFGVFWPFLVSFSLSRAVSACFWHCIWHLPTPDICLTHSDTILTLPDTLRHHPDTHQTPPYLVCMRPLGERVISEYHDIYSTGLNLYSIYPPKTSTWHTQTPSRHCQTPSDTIQTPLRNPHIWPAWHHWEKE